MTWVLGTPTILGYGLIIADIQVSVHTPNGTEFIDGIQKVFPVGRYIAAGFAGDVEFGFRLIEDLARCLELPAEDEDTGWLPAWVMDRWQHRARSLFAEWGGDEERGVDLLVAGAWQEDTTPTEEEAFIAHIFPPGVRTYACILRSPAFAVEVIRPMTVGSIGSGNDVEAYRRLLNDMNQHPAAYLHAEIVGGVRDGLASVMGHSLGGDIEKTPAPGISPHMLICVVRPDSISLTPNDSDWIVGPNERKPQRRMPPLARSWSELEALMQSRGLAEGEARALRG